MKNQQTSHVRNGSATTRGADGALTRRELIGASVPGAGLLGSGVTPLIAESAQSKAPALARRQGRRVIDSHVHLWKLPRNAPPMSDNATSPRVAAAQSAGWKSIVCRPIPAFNQCDDQFDPDGQTGPRDRRSESPALS